MPDYMSAMQCSCNDSTDLVRLYSDLVPYTMVLSKIYAIRVKTLSCMQLGNGCNCVRVASKVCGHEAYGGPTRCCLLSRCTILDTAYMRCRPAHRMLDMGFGWPIHVCYV
jgi:hypothetical protein